MQIILTIKQSANLAFRLRVIENYYVKPESSVSNPHAVVLNTELVSAFAPLGPV